MSKSFMKGVEPFPVPARRKCFPCPNALGDALIDLKNEGLDNLDEIAEDYGLNPMLLLRRFHGVQLSS